MTEQAAAVGFYRPFTLLFLLAWFLAACGGLTETESPTSPPIVDVIDEVPVVSNDELLTWSPPELHDPIHLHVPAWPSSNVVRLEAGRDYMIHLPATEPVRRGLILSGGRNVVVLGGHIRIPWQGWNPTIASRTGLKIRGATGIVHLEGLLIDGPDLSEGIQINAPQAIVQIQNVGVFDMTARDLSGFTDNHPDVIQTYGNVRELRVDRLTATTPYQGVFLKADKNGAHGPVHLKRVEIIGDSTARYLLWMHPQSGRAEVVLEDVWLAVHHSRAGGIGRSVWPNADAHNAPFAAVVGRSDDLRTVSWPTSSDPQIFGVANEGRAPDGPYVEREDVGLVYVSPGYVPSDYVAD